MDESRAINGNVPHADMYRTKATSAADDGDGGGLGNAYEKHGRAHKEEDESSENQDPSNDGVVESQGSDPLLQALDRMAAVEGYHPVDAIEIAHVHAERVYGSSTIRRKSEAKKLPEALSKLEQHQALEAKRVENLVDDVTVEQDPPNSDQDDEYLPHSTDRHTS